MGILRSQNYTSNNLTTLLDVFWFTDFKIFKDLPVNINDINDNSGQQWCCTDYTEGAEILTEKTCNWKNQNIKGYVDADMQEMYNNNGTTGFLCKWLQAQTDSDKEWKDFGINITTEELRSGLVSLTGLLDPATQLPWYDTGRQWPKQSTCSYGSAMDQMTMTYISFTGYLR